MPKALDELFDVRHRYRDVIVVKPKPSGGDPYTEAAEILTANWTDNPWGARTMAVDTVTQWANTFLGMSADIGRYAPNNPIQFGRGKTLVNIPSEGDYRAAQTLVQELTDLAFDLPMDVCFAGHVGNEAKGKRGTPGYAILNAGMATIGSAQVSTYGGQFDQYIRLKYKSKQDKTNLVAQLMGDSIYAAKVREDGANPAPRDVLLNNDKDPKKQLEGLRQFWLDRALEAGLDLADPETTGYFRAALYGALGTGKTRLMLCMPRTPIVYVAVDKNSEFLRSMLASMKIPVQAAA